MRIIPLTSSILLLYLVMNSCVSNDAEIRKLKLENSQLKSELLELRTFKDSLKVTAYIDNTSFETTVDEPYNMQLFTIIQDDIEIESIYINEQKVDTSQEGLLTYSYTDYGPRIIFRSDTTGTFNFKVLAKFNVWDDKIVPLSWPITVIAEKE